MALLPNERQKEIDHVVQDIKLRTGITFPEGNIVELVKALGIKVYEVDLSAYPNVKGAVQYQNKAGKIEPIIYINKNISPYGKTFTLAHELGHYLLHKGEDKLRIDEYDYSQNTKESLQESEANYFAASLLVPKEKLLKVLAVTDKIDTIANYFGVSKPVVETRIQWIKKNR